MIRSICKQKTWLPAAALALVMITTLASPGVYAETNDLGLFKSMKLDSIEPDKAKKECTEYMYGENSGLCLIRYKAIDGKCDNNEKPYQGVCVHAEKSNKSGCMGITEKFCGMLPKEMGTRPDEQK